jgi:WD40 repeat protein
VFRGHEAEVQSIVLSPDVKRLLTTTHVSIRLWDLAAGKLVGDPRRGNFSGRSVSFSPDGKTFFVVRHGIARKDIPEILLADATTGEPIGAPLRRPRRFDSATFSPDGQTILTSSHRSDDEAELCLWDVRTHKQRWAQGGFTRNVKRTPDTTAPLVFARFSPDGRTILTATPSGILRLWETATGKPRSEPLRQEDGFRTVAFSPDGKTFATASYATRDGVRLWETATLRPLGAPLRYQGAADLVAFSPDGKVLFAGAFEPGGRLWEVATGKPIGEYFGGYGVIFSPDGKLVLTGGTLWETATGRPLARGVGTFSHDGKTLLGMAGDDQTAVSLWKVPVPLEGSVERLRLWLEVGTGRELDAGGAVVELDWKTWQQRWQRLQKLGGPPVP